jgi:hypothetical protein
MVHRRTSSSACGLLGLSCGQVCKLFAVMVLWGCDLAGPRSRVDVSVVVNPDVIRTIHYYSAGPNLLAPPAEVTTKRLEDIACLHTTPRGCRVRETVAATIHNTGTHDIYWDDCHQPLERWGLGSWHPVTRYPCAGPALSVRPSIRPGDARVFEVSVEWAPPGEYRVRFALSDAVERVPDSASTSAAFQLVPLPDSPQFICPTESRAGLAARIAREALDSAAVGGRTPDIREMLWIETRVPGFGGLWLENGSRTAWLEDLSRTNELVALQTPYGRIEVVKKGDYSFSELVAWKEVIARGGGFSILGTNGLDADEKENRVSVSISNELIRGDVECFVRGIGMPEGMPNIELR